MKWYLLLGTKAMKNLESALNSRGITLPTKVLIVRALVFPAVMYRCESWTIKKAEHRRIDAFELRCWRRPLRVTWTARQSNQPILKEISPEHSLEGLMLKLKLHLIRRINSFEKTLMLGKIEGGRRRGRQRVRWLDDGRVSASSRSWWWTGKSGVLWSMGSQRVGHDWAIEQQLSLHSTATEPPCSNARSHRSRSWCSRAEQPVLQGRSACAPGQSSLCSRADQPVLQDRAVCAPGQRRLCSRAEKPVLQGRAAGAPGQRSLCSRADKPVLQGREAARRRRVCTHQSSRSSQLEQARTQQWRQSTAKDK